MHLATRKVTAGELQIEDKIFKPVEVFHSNSKFEGATGEDTPSSS
jgi:hypothetical protein